MNKTPIWVKDAIIIIVLSYLAFSFVIGTMDCTSWEYSERSSMMLVNVAGVAITQFFRGMNGEYDQ